MSESPIQTHPQHIAVRFYDGQRSKPYQAQIFAVDGGVAVQVNDHQHIFAFDQITVLAGVGSVMPTLELPNEMRVELLQPTLPDWIQSGLGHLEQRVWRLEGSPLLIMASLVLVVATVFAVARFGMPQAAHAIALMLPQNTLDGVGDQTEQQLIAMTDDSTLTAAQQTHIRQLYDRYVEPNHASRLVFREGGRFDANAFALPNGTIVVTDELVKLANDDMALVGVLAHEHGHVVYRHNLQQAISGLGLSALIAWMTGDVSDLMSGLPAALLAMQYSRDFEREADDYAIHHLQNQQLPILPLANFLTKLEQQHSDESSTRLSVWSWFASHPDTAERVNAIRLAAQRMPEKQDP